MRDAFVDMKEDEPADEIAEALFGESAELEASAKAAYAMWKSTNARKLNDGLTIILPEAFSSKH
eukprot:4359783-Pleurochrysis_carterae.AAC.1